MKKHLKIILIVGFVIATPPAILVAFNFVPNDTALTVASSSAAPAIGSVEEHMKELENYAAECAESANRVKNTLRSNGFVLVSKARTEHDHRLEIWRNRSKFWQMWVFNSLGCPIPLGQGYDLVLLPGTAI